MPTTSTWFPCDSSSNVSSLCVWKWKSAYLRSLIQVLFPIGELSQLCKLVVLQNVGALWQERNKCRNNSLKERILINSNQHWIWFIIVWMLHLLVEAMKQLFCDPSVIIQQFTFSFFLKKVLKFKRWIFIVSLWAVHIMLLYTLLITKSLYTTNCIIAQVDICISIFLYIL